MPIAEYLPALVDEILANFPERMTVKIEKQIDDFILDVNILQPLGIIINELLTNTMKYAFKGRKDCLITISAKISGRNVTILIQDNGKGLPESFDPDKPGGFGMQLVSILAEQIGGHIRIERGEGTKFALEFVV
jgi:two-component sensor histidine kinase